ncbi:hypothetical protein Cgig2_017158 [Carnegiea gigantea]|uniref:Uncharacterized protein n=1 Tax=Carnegiea gigantea TaxID=171969 RepID=A0A9Q1GHV8_9CARY|nr:hypothetical protein Cgig2_017158 [Carnegiea gigantea]
MAREGRRAWPKQRNVLMSPGGCVAAQNREDEAEVSLHPEITDGTVQTVPEQIRVSTMDSEVITSPTRSPVSSYTAMTAPDEGISLTFVQSQEFNGVKCARIESTDKSSALCSVLGANPLLETIEGFIRRIWRTFDIDKICLVKKGGFLEPQEVVPSHPHIDQEGFITVRKKATAATAGNKNMPPAITVSHATIPVQNTF